MSIIILPLFFLNQFDIASFIDFEATKTVDPNDDRIKAIIILANLILEFRPKYHKLAVCF